MFSAFVGLLSARQVISGIFIFSVAGNRRVLGVAWERVSCLGNLSESGLMIASCSFCKQSVCFQELLLASSSSGELSTGNVTLIDSAVPESSRWQLSYRVSVRWCVVHSAGQKVQA